MMDAAISATWTYPTKIWFGPGRLDELASGCAEIGMRRPLIVADPYISTGPVMQKLRAALSGVDIESAVFDGLQGNPTSRNLDDGIAAFRAGGHDGVIAIGGGSALDVGKTVAFMVAQDRPVWEFEDIGTLWRAAKTGGIAPIIAVPTTSGTGSEVGRATVITNAESHEKKIIFHPQMMPRLVIADPELMVSLPPVLTAGTGMDALAHNLEAYCAPGYHPMADAIATDGIRLIQKWLPVAFVDGGDLEARTHVMAAAMMGGTAFQKGLGAIHALSHPIGSVYGFHHGLTNAVLMPYVIDHNRTAIAEKLDHLAHCMRLPGAGSGTDRFLQWVLDLRRDLGIPHTLADLGVRPEMFDKIAKMSLADPTAATNPVPLTLESARSILTAASEGRLFHTTAGSPRA
jgi:alcohol dehydrogenase class IV